MTRSKNTTLNRTAVEIETHRRIKLAVWAYAYEVLDEPLVEDHVFDREALLVDLTINTTRPEMDRWFRKEFVPDSGVWIHRHPDLEGIKRICALMAGAALPEQAKSEIQGMLF